MSKKEDTDLVENPLYQHILNAEKFVAGNSLLTKELMKAKVYYQEKTGKFRETNENYENSINAFHYWFLFDWGCTFKTDKKVSPYQIYLDNNPLVRQDSKQCVHSQIHSLFEFIKVTKTETVIFDLFSKKKLKIPDTETLFSFEKGCYFETRLINFQGKLFFSPFLTMHPAVVYRQLRKQIKLIRKQPDKWPDFLLYLSHLHYKWVNYPKFNVSNIYVFKQ